MGSNTSKLGLYLPGGGSTGLITPDEPADIDKINDNMSKIDADAGAFVCTSSTRPSSPYNGKIIYETDTKNTRVWRSATSTWDLVNRVTETVPIANGGTGGTTVAEAKTNLNIPPNPAHAVAQFAATQGTLVNPPNGIIVKTGVASGTTSPAGVLIYNFPTAFPTALIATVLMHSNNTQLDAMLVEASQSASSIQIFFPGAGSVARKMQFIAFGY